MMEGNTFKVILEKLDTLGYYVKWQVLNALDFGLPQKRERVIIVGFKSKEDCEKFSFEIPYTPYNLADILEDDKDVDPTLFASEHIIAKRQKKMAGKRIFYPSIWHENKAGNISVLDYSCALRTGASYNYLLVNGVRRPTSREFLRLQGFPEKYKIAISHQDIRRQTGNSVAVPMIRMVANKINEIIKSKKHGTSETQRRLLTREPYHINEIPESLIKLVGKKLVYMLCVGYKDLTGDDWGNVFAEVIGGEHLQSPVGIADVVFDKMHDR